MADIVDRFTKPGELVCDPFVGAGTTGVVSVTAGRRFVGMDVDAEHVARARARIAEVAGVARRVGRVGNPSVMGEGSKTGEQRADNDALTHRFR
jgi:DNA modification methylase